MTTEQKQEKTVTEIENEVSEKLIQLNEFIAKIGLTNFVGVAQLLTPQGLGTFQVSYNAGMVEMFGAARYLDENAKIEVMQTRMRIQRDQEIHRANQARAASLANQPRVHAPPKQPQQ